MHDNPDVPSWDSRNPNRTPMQWNGGIGAGFTSRRFYDTWLPIHQNFRTINLQSEREKNHGTYRYFQTLTKLRQGAVLKEGDYNDYLINDHVFAYTRFECVFVKLFISLISTLLLHRQLRDEEGYVIVINMSGTEQLVDLSEVSTLGNNVLNVIVAAPTSGFEAG